MIAALGLAAALAAAGPAPVQLAVPLVAQTPERCGPAALAMVLRFYGAAPSALAGVERAYDRTLRGTLITELARAARAAGYPAAIESPGPDSLIALLREGVPAILMVESGIGPVARAHYVVVVGWEPGGDRFVLHDGGSRPVRLDRAALERRRRGQDARALVVRRPPPGAG